MSTLFEEWVRILGTASSDINPLAFERLNRYEPIFGYDEEEAVVLSWRACNAG